MRAEIARQREAFQQGILRQKEEAFRIREQRRREAAARVDAARSEAKREEERRREERAHHAILNQEELTRRVLKVHGAVSTCFAGLDSSGENWSEAVDRSFESPSPRRGLATLPPRPGTASPRSSPPVSSEVYSAASSPRTRSGMGKIWLEGA